jgi:putative solute:sodium symporter small subunit
MVMRRRCRAPGGHNAKTLGRTVRDFSEIAWWRETRQLALAVAAGLVVVALLPALLAGHVGDRLFAGMRFGTFVGAILAPLAAVVAAFVFTVWQRRIDRRHDVADD